MKIKMLPNWCKKLGLAIFIIGASASLYSGWTSAVCPSPDFLESAQVNNQNTTSMLLNTRNMDLVGVITVIGMFIYMFSKEKTEDDYINILRLESFQLTSLIGLAAIIIIYLISGNLSFEIDYIVNLFLIFYLITFAIKKRSY